MNSPYYIKAHFDFDELWIWIDMAGFIFTGLEPGTWELSLYLATPTPNLFFLPTYPRLPF